MTAKKSISQLRDMSIVARIERSIEKIPEAGCHIWMRCVTKAGYGQMGVNKKSLYAHRMSYELAYGAIPDGLHVCHRCDNPACVNPHHLFLGTPADNSRDKISKGRHPKGELMSKLLNDEQVVSIRNDHRRQQEISNEYGISIAEISNIQNGIRWQHVLTDGRQHSNKMIEGAHQVRGVDHKLAKLNDAIVRKIRASMATDAEMAAEAGVSRMTIRRVRSHRSWAHVI